jgi:glutamine synthetase type III
MRDLYQMTVETEAKALYNMANKKIIPRATRYLQELQSSIGSTNTFIKSYADNFAQTLGHSLQKLDELRVSMEKCGDVQEAGVLREKIVSIGEELGEICSLLSKDPSFPDL